MNCFSIRTEFVRFKLLPFIRTLFTSRFSTQKKLRDGIDQIV